LRSVSVPSRMQVAADLTPPPRFRRVETCKVDPSSVFWPKQHKRPQAISIRICVVENPLSVRREAAVTVFSQHTLADHAPGSVSPIAYDKALAQS
jgi:hypothetical protein